jgi:hypothetical protein
MAPALRGNRQTSARARPGTVMIALTKAERHAAATAAPPIAAFRQRSRRRIQLNHARRSRQVHAGQMLASAMKCAEHQEVVFSILSATVPARPTCAACAVMVPTTSATYVQRHSSRRMLLRPTRSIAPMTIAVIAQVFATPVTHIVEIALVTGVIREACACLGLLRAPRKYLRPPPSPSRRARLVLALASMQSALAHRAPGTPTYALAPLSTATAAPTIARLHAAVTTAPPIAALTCKQYSVRWSKCRFSLQTRNPRSTDSEKSGPRELTGKAGQERDRRRGFNCAGPAAPSARTLLTNLGVHGPQAVSRVSVPSQLCIRYKMGFVLCICRGEIGQAASRPSGIWK